jgi:hypothetical protein
VTIVQRIGGARPFALFAEQLDTLYAGAGAADKSEISASISGDRQP